MTIYRSTDVFSVDNYRRWLSISANGIYDGLYYKFEDLSREKESLLLALDVSEEEAKVKASEDRLMSWEWNLYDRLVEVNKEIVGVEIARALRDEGGDDDSGDED